MVYAHRDDVFCVGLVSERASQVPSQLDEAAAATTPAGARLRH